MAVSPLPIRYRVPTHPFAPIRVSPDLDHVDAAVFPLHDASPPAGPPLRSGCGKPHGRIPVLGAGAGMAVISCAGFRTDFPELQILVFTPFPRRPKIYRSPGGTGRPRIGFLHWKDAAGIDNRRSMRISRVLRHAMAQLPRTCQASSKPVYRHSIHRACDRLDGTEGRLGFYWRCEFDAYHAFAERFVSLRFRDDARIQNISWRSHDAGVYWAIPEVVHCFILPAGDGLCPCGMGARTQS